MIELIIGLLLIVSGSNRDDNPGEIISKANNEFSFKIFKMLSKDENDIISSLSILSALSILMNGAKGETLSDMQRFLEYKNLVEDIDEETINEGFEQITRIYQGSIEEKILGPNDLFNLDNFKHQLNMANRLIHSNKTKLIPYFKNNINEYFRADIQSADFENNSVEETNKVNEWVRNKTNNKIQKLFDDVGRDTTLLIINVLYFKGQWEETFYEGSTKKLDFYNNGVTPVKTDIMTQTDRFNYAESEELDSQVLEMDYIGKQISFVIVLPKQRNGLQSLKEKINARNFERVLKSMTKRNTEVFIPKFKVEKSYELMDEINPKPIALTKEADFRRMISQSVMVCKIKHKVFIDLNEKGTEAAAVTAIKIIPMSAYIPNENIIFRADHPFLYFIRDKTNAMILFSGQINKL